MTTASRFVIIDRTQPGVYVDGAVDPDSIRPACQNLDEIDDACLALLVSDRKRFVATLERFILRRSDTEVARMMDDFETIFDLKFEQRDKNLEPALVDSDAEI